MSFSSPMAQAARANGSSLLSRLVASPQAPLVLAWALFGLLLRWGWRVPLWNAVPSYGDVLQVLWGIEWYHNALFNGADVTFSPLVFYPAGWHVATFSHGPGLFMLLLPLYKLGGAAFAVNAGFVLFLAVGFWGM